MTLPIRISVLDGETVLYSEVTKFPTEIPPGTPGAQVIFRKDGIKMPVGSGALVRVNVGFDTQRKQRPRRAAKGSSGFDLTSALIRLPPPLPGSSHVPPPR